MEVAWSTNGVNSSAVLPSLYEYYTSGGIHSGLDASKNNFTLNGKDITIYSGAMHYFRIPRKYWGDRLRKMRAAGLNTVETYIPWNLHEPAPGNFDFGQGGSDMQDFLDIAGFLKTAQEEDLLVILRPGPYICAEWEFGGLPSWLLREKDIRFRTSDPKYMNPVKRFFNMLLPILAAFQFINGGPIIMFQVENEYASLTSKVFSPDKTYLKELRQLYLDNNITELLVTADGVLAYGAGGSIPGYFLIVANFGGDPTTNFNILQKLQPNRPKLAMEYYPGWFDHWGEDHHTTSGWDLIMNLEEIIHYPASFNIYMFIGGTDFGLINGANLYNDGVNNNGYQPDTTSYDYDAPLTEAGDYTFKYNLIKVLLEKYAFPKLRLPQMPQLVKRTAYPSINVVEHISLKSLIDSQPNGLVYSKTLPMELINTTNNAGQSYGYIVYRKENVNLPAGSILTIQGHVCDTVLVLINGQLVSPALRRGRDLDNFGFWKQENASLIVTMTDLTSATIDLVTENWGRVGYGKLPQYNQFKGLWQGDILLNNKVLTDWQHISLEFKKTWTNNINNWEPVAGNSKPGLYKGYINIETPADTYINMEKWTKGIVIINGFVIGRFSKIGPQQCLYLPAPLIREGLNEVIIFEHYEAYNAVEFSTDQIWKTNH